MKLWQFGDAENGLKGAKFLKVSENGRVPALEDPNTNVTSWESGACLNYLLRVYDKGSKLGPSDSEQARVDFDKWIFFLVSSIGPYVSSHQPDSPITGNHNPPQANTHVSMMGQVNWFRHYHSSKNDDALARYEEQAYRTFGVLEGQLKSHDGQYVLPGKSISGVDCHIYPWL